MNSILEMADDVSKEAVMSLLRKREKEIVRLQEKCKQMDVLTSRQKTLMKDRRVFQRFCRSLGVADCELLFESSLAQESPIDLDELLRCAKGVTELKQISEDFREFASLVLGEVGDGVLDIKQLRKRWMERDSTGDATDGLVSLTAHEELRRQAERIAELEAELEGVRTATAVSTSDVFVNTVSPVVMDASVGCPNPRTDELAPLRDQLEAKSAEINICLDRIHSGEKERKLLLETVSRLESQVLHLEGEKNKYSFVEEIAGRQAERDLETANLRAEIQRLRRQVGLADDGSERKIFSNDVLVKFISYAIVSDFEKMRTLIPVLCELFQLSDADAAEIDRLCTATPAAWLPTFLQ